MGDAVDGVHHQTTELVTTRPEEQERMHIECMDWGLRRAKFRKGDILQYIGGTQSHVRSSAQSEERIARDLEARPMIAPTDQDGKDGRFVYDRRQFSVDDVTFDLCHNAFTVGKRAWTETNTLNYALKSIYFEALETGQTLPRYKIGAHWHYFLEGIHKGKQGTIEGIICPGFQWRTEFANLVTNNSIRLPSVGMLIIVVEADGRSWYDCPMVEAPEREYERL